MEVSNSASVSGSPEWRQRLDFAVQCVGFQQQLEAMQEGGSAAVITDGSTVQMPSDITASSPEEAARSALAASGALLSAVDAFGRTPEEARAQVGEWQKQDEAVDALRRQMGLPPINRGYNADYNPQNLDLKTMHPHGWVAVDPAELARERSIKDAGNYVNDTRQFEGKPIIESLGFDPDVIKEARRRAGLATDNS